MRDHAMNRSRAFTLIELIVAVGAVALIAVGIAAVFESVGRTVSGGKRVSRLNQFAALVERQMREDFENMTRDGVLVIRHQYVYDREPIPLHEEDAAPRARRGDEILFMRRGDFTTARAPTLPGVVASTSEQIVSYGHGIRFNPLEDLPGKSVTIRDPRFDRPHIADGREPNRMYRAGNELGSDAEPGNPNRYAAYWTLLRKATGLAVPSSSDPDLPPASDTAYWNSLGIDRTDALDNEFQIGGQPAMATALRSIARLYRVNRYDTVRRAADDPANWAPLTSSGIIDLATCDLAEIRRIVMDAGVYPWDFDLDYLDPLDPSYILDGQQAATLDLNNPVNNLLHMHAWMEDLFPTDTTLAPGHVPQRPRYEPRFADFVGTLSTYGDDGSDTGRTREAYRLADQRMLTSSVFAPNCSEFIVEYSFGQRNTDDTSPAFGETIWYGMHRDVDIDGAATAAARPYPEYVDPTDGGQVVQGYPFDQRFLRRDGSVGTRTLSPNLVYGVPDWNNDQRNLLVAHFGYNDPVYSPGSDEDPETIPWQWPKLIRVTVTLADPANPSNEETFQFIFETPDGKVF